MMSLDIVKFWVNEFNLMVGALWRWYTQMDKISFANVYIRSVDAISITFELRYNDTRNYRIRWSPLEFRNY